MCGIAAYQGERNASQLLLASLRRLEYRGYDSVGIATSKNGHIHIEKGAGNIHDVTERLDFSLAKGTRGIGHTRWATTGQVNDKNAHPHLSNNKAIAVVHNGIVENHCDLRERLEQKGFTFQSDTDTEVIPNLIELKMRSGLDFAQAFYSTIDELEGTYAIVALNKDKILFAKHTSPLVIGLGEGEQFIGSDATAFMEHTRTAIFLEDGDRGELKAHPDIFDINSEPVTRQTSPINWSLEEARKGSYPHFMLKEINEQDQTIQRAIEQDPHLLEQVIETLRSAFGIFLVACGTSYHACRVASYLFSHVAKKHVNLSLASEFNNYTDFITDKTLIIAVSQSGETADVIDAVRAAKERGARVISIVNVMGSTLARMADNTLLMNAGPEICVLSTKSYTSQVALLTLLSYALAGHRERAVKAIKASAGRVKEVLEASDPIARRLARSFKDAKDIFVIGRDVAYPTALEGALKIKEVSYIHAEGFAGGELKHGSIALIEQGTPCFVFVTEATRSRILSNAEEIRSRGGKAIGIDTKPSTVFDDMFTLPFDDPLLMILPIQLFAYYLALERGCDPDKPRNLAKSVTVR